MSMLDKDATVYYGSICPCNGFLDYDTDPPHFEAIPPAGCVSAGDYLVSNAQKQKLFVA